MKILNIHGYMGKKDNANFRILKGMDLQIISPQLDYNAYTPNQIYAQIFELVEAENPDLILATSFGCFFAKHISINFNIPCILVNPCLRPEISLRRIAPDYFNKENGEEVIRWVEDHKNSYSNDYIICGTADTVIDHKVTEEEIGNNSIRYIEGGNHSVDEKLYSAEIISAIRKFVKEI